MCRNRLQNQNNRAGGEESQTPDMVSVICFLPLFLTKTQHCPHLPSEFTTCRDTAGQERFRTITTAYYRGAMVLLPFLL